MHSAKTLLAALLLAGCGPAWGTTRVTEAPAPEYLSLSALEGRLADIDTELEQLAHLSLRSGVGANGFRSVWHETRESPEWVQVDLGEEAILDEIVLAPTLWRDSKKGFQAEGLPLQFRIVAGNKEGKKGKVIATYTEQDRLLPRIAPVVVPCPGAKASWVRIEADRLSTRGGDDKFILQFSELLVFSGPENIALGRPVTCPAESPPIIGNWGNQYLTDGFTPFLMDAAKGDKSVAFLSGTGVAEQPTITIDLGSVCPVSRIHLHALDQGDTAPQAFSSDFCLPRHLRIEGATESDFSDASLLADTYCNNLYEAGPIIMRRFAATQCRYVRLTAIEPYIFNDGMKEGTRIAFAEVEIFAGGENVALGKQATSNLKANPRGERPLSRLTDGHNFYGHILPIREWMNQLARRHDLETERPIVATELSRRYARQKTNLRLMSWLAALLAAGIVFILLVDRIIRLRQAARIRERFAADLHDELGANLHAIGLLGDLAKDAVASPDDLIETVDEIRAITERTSAAARFCTDMHAADGLYGSLPEDMQRAAKRILADIEYDISIEGEAFLKRLKPRTRTDLFLFYKEALVNISRHSSATQVNTRLIVDSREVRLTISDNGEGTESVPASLERRARLLGANVAIETPKAGGTCIALTLRPRRWRLREKLKTEMGTLASHTAKGTHHGDTESRS